MNLREFKRVLQQVFFIPILAVMATAAALFLQIREANQTVNLIQLTDQRISQSTLAAKLIVDQESGLRGYAATDDARFLEPYITAQAEIDEVFNELERLPGADEHQKDAIRDLREAYGTWRDGFATPLIGMVKDGDRARDLPLNMEGKMLMDGMREDIEAITRRSEDRRTLQIARWHQQTWWTLLALVGVGTVLGVLIGMFARNRLQSVSSAYRSTLDALHRRAEEIFQSEQQLRTTLNSIGDGVITCDSKGNVQMINPVAEDLTGWPQEKAGGRPLDEVFHALNEATRERIENPVAKVMRLNKIVGLANHTVLIANGGREVHIADSAAPIRDKVGRISGVVMVFRDVTMERKTQTALVANEKLALAGRLAATIAHEIHNPLDSVTNLLYLMRTGTTEEEFEQFMEMAEKEMARVTEISRALLGLYRESTAPILVDLGATMYDILLLMERHIRDLGVRLEVNLPEGICVSGFPAELRQVFTNLVANAAEAAGKGGMVRLSLRLEQRTADETGRVTPGAVVEIADDGPGIPEEVLPQLFQPFFTTKGEQGTGLGLWVSRGIAGKHGGTIELRGRRVEGERGTIAEVFLPIAATAPLTTA